MAKIVGMLNSTHVPAIGGAIAKGKQQDPYWKPWFDSFAPVHAWLAKIKPTTIVTFSNDHGLNFFLNAIPTFAIGTAPKFTSADEGWGIPVFSEYKGNEELSWHIREGLHNAEIDMTTCQEMYLDHAITIPIELFWPAQECPVKVVPILTNTILFPIPNASRCEKMGKAVGAAIESWNAPDERILVVGGGGLSHQLEGERAGHINKKFDLECVDHLSSYDLEWFRKLTSEDIVEVAGSQGLELLNWISARSASPAKMKEIHRFNHIPISNTSGTVLALETI